MTSVKYPGKLQFAFVGGVIVIRGLSYKTFTDVVPPIPQLLLSVIV
ncbi:MAG: hypothetical protein AB7E37_00445 [Candidatus Altimarinota bacterium]